MISCYFSIHEDEFSNWIMNADVKPYVPKSKEKELSPTEILRKNLNASIAEHPQTFQYMKKKTSFMELVSDVNRLKMTLKEKDVRAIFLLLDPQETGFVDSQALLYETFFSFFRLSYIQIFNSENKFKALGKNWKHKLTERGSEACAAAAD